MCNVLFFNITKMFAEVVGQLSSRYLLVDLFTGGAGYARGLRGCQ